MSVFTDIDPAYWTASNDLAFAIRDRYPVSPGHTLVITKREVPTWFEATPEEQRAVMALVDEVKQALDREFAPAGYNVGFNAGEAAGQTVMHLHVHVIPRYAGDMDDPRGGVRHVIPGKGNYLAAAEPVRTAAPVDGNGPRGPQGPDGREPPGASRDADNPLATGGDTDPFLRHLAPHLGRAHAIDILAAFVQQSGVDRVLPFLREALARGATVRVLTGDYLDITQAEGLAQLMDLAASGVDAEDDDVAPPAAATDEAHDGGAVYLPAAATGSLALRVVEVEAQQLKSFHPKSWRLEAPSFGLAWVGSSNLSATALGAGVEWNLRVDRDRDPLAYRRVREAFEAIWTRARTPDAAWLAAYEARASREPPSIPAWEVGEPPPPPRDPHPVQTAALDALEEARAAGRTRGLVVLATGLGKTLLAAFDFARLAAAAERPLRLLFVAHRRELLRQAAGAFRTALAQQGRFPRIGFCVDGDRELDGDLVFASVATLAQPRMRDRLHAQHFDYVVFDEVHHATAPSWRRVLAALDPGFLLGLTATPDRADNADVLGLFDDCILFEAGIPEGLHENLLAPFHYYGVRDTIDFKNLPWRNRPWNLAALTTAAATEARMETLWRAWQAHPGTRTLVFCCSVFHAQFVRKWLLDRGVNAAAVYAGTDSDDRATALDALAAGTLQALCAVDLFNEGVDVPAVDRVVMLRPTESNVLFLQQLGRGLRVHPDKERLCVIDFVGNHRVFQRRIESLLRAGGGEHAPSLNALIAPDAPPLELAPGCLVELELEAKDVLRDIIGPPSVVEEVYRELRERRGERPRAGELQRMGYRPGALRARHGSWFEFVAAELDLTPEEAAALPALREFLRVVETTEMTKGFKMVTLAVLAECENPLEGLAISELSFRCRAWLRRRPELWRDVIPAEQGELENDAARRRWQKYWEKNPIHHLTTGKRPLCRVVNDRLSLLCADAQKATLTAMLWEIVDLRLAQYQERFVPSPAAGVIHCKLIQANGRPIAKLPDRGHHEFPQGEMCARLPDGSVWVFRLMKEFINVAHPAGETANRFGELMQSWFGEQAGQPGTAFQIEFSAHPDGWWVAPAGPSQAGQLSIGMLIDEAALATMFGEPSLRPATGVYGSRLFLFVNAADMLTSPDRVHFQGDEFPGADTCAVLALREQRYQYLGAGHRRDEEKCWEIPEVDFETWRRWGHGRTASRRLPPEKMAQASELVARVLGLPAEERKFERLGGGQGLVLGGASQGGLRIGAPDGEFRERTVSLNDIAWVLVAAEDVEHTGGSLDEARVNRLRYLKGTPKSSTRYIDTGWAIGVWRRWKK